MAVESDGAKGSRVPTRGDLRRIADSLNSHGVRYAIIGGFAMFHHGLLRATQDIDLLVDPTPENVERIRQALSILEDAASMDLAPDDVERYTVVRVADEVVVDLLGQACGVRLADVLDEIEVEELDGVEVRYLSARALLRTKQTVRPKDAIDRRYLEQFLNR